MPTTDRPYPNKFKIKMSAVDRKAMRALFVRYQKSPSESLRNEIVTKNVGLLYDIYDKYPRFHNVSRDDMVSIATPSLIRCVEKFNPALGYAFSTYACRAIINAMTKGMCTNDFLGFNRRKSGDERKVLQFSDMAAAESRFYRSGVNLRPAEPPSAKSERDEILRFMSILDSRHRKVIRGRFFLDRTLENIAEELGVTKERIRQMQNRALRQMREAAGLPSLAKRKPRLPGV